MQRGLTVRRALMVLTLCTGVPAIAWVQARAQVEQTLLERSRALFDLSPSWQRTPPRALFLNGARVVVATGTSEQPLRVMLDHFQERCRSDGGGLTDFAQQAFGKPRSELPSLIDGVLRIEEERQGLVACLGLGERKLAHEELWKRVERFADTTDLAVFGGLRVVRVESMGDRTFFVASWSDGPLPLGSMFPESGDSPGADPVHAPRPADARRLLSAWQEGLPSSVHLYVASRPRDEAFAAYAQALEQSGWTNQHAPSMTGGAPMQGTIFARGTQSMAVHAQSLGDETVLSVFSLEPREDRLVQASF